MINRWNIPRSRCGGARYRRLKGLFCAFGLVLAASPQCVAGEGLPLQGPDYDVIVALGVESVGVFRGIRSRRLNPSVYGVLEVTVENFYGGVYSNAVNIAGETSPLLLGYAGYKPEALGVTFDVGARYYSFVGSSDIAFDENDDGIIDRFGRKGVFETKLGATKYFPKGRASTTFLFTPDSLGETDPAYYIASEVRRDIGAGFNLRADAGWSWYEDKEFNDDYLNYGVGVFKSAWGFDMFLRYSDTVARAGGEDRIVVFGIERTFGVISKEGARTRLFRKIRNDILLDKNSISVGQ